MTAFHLYYILQTTWDYIPALQVASLLYVTESHRIATSQYKHKSCSL